MADGTGLQFTLTLPGVDGIAVIATLQQPRQGTAPTRHVRELCHRARVAGTSATLKDYSFKHPAYSQQHQAQLHEHPRC